MTTFYTQNGWAGKNYDSKLSTKEIAAKVRTFAKKQFPEFKFSITSRWSMYADSMYIVLKSGPCPAFMEGSLLAKRGRFETMSSVKSFEKDGLTPEAFAALDGICSYAASFRYDDSDGMQDYFDTNFYLKIEINDDYQVIEPKGKEQKKTKATEKLESIEPVKAEDLEIVDYSEKAIAVFGETKAIKDELKKLGGKFNPSLKHNGEKRAGWIFSKKQADKVWALLAPASEPSESVTLPEPPTDALEQVEFAKASKAFIQEWRKNNPYTGSDHLEEFNSKFNCEYSAFVEKWANDNGTQISSYMIPTPYPIERKEYKETELDQQKKQADILLESIDGDWYTLRLNRNVNLKNKRVRQYDNGTIAVPENAFLQLKKQYVVLTDF